jgi:hypothetical protein
MMGIVHTKRHFEGKYRDHETGLCKGVDLKTVIHDPILARMF